jgi:hypothetical protein
MKVSVDTNLDIMDLLIFEEMALKGNLKGQFKIYQPCPILLDVPQVRAPIVLSYWSIFGAV